MAWWNKDKGDQANNVAKALDVRAQSEQAQKPILKDADEPKSVQVVDRTPNGKCPACGHR